MLAGKDCPSILWRLSARLLVNLLKKTGVVTSTRNWFWSGDQMDFNSNRNVKKSNKQNRGFSITASLWSAQKRVRSNVPVSRWLPVIGSLYSWGSHLADKQGYKGTIWPGWRTLEHLGSGRRHWERHNRLVEARWQHWRHNQTQNWPADLQK